MGAERTTRGGWVSAAASSRSVGVDFVVLDGNDRPGGAWQHRWDSLTMHDVHGVADLPGMPLGEVDPSARANVVVPAYFAEYEGAGDLPVARPIASRRSPRSTTGMTHKAVR